MPIKAGGIGAFTWNFAKLLRGAGEQVEVVLTGPLPNASVPWQEPFKALGVTLKYLHAAPLIVPKGYSWQIKAAEETAAAIDPRADVVYFADWQANGVHFMRSRRFRTEHGPTTVTVLHSSSKWLREAQRTFAHSKDDLWLDFSEAYAAQHSDFVVSPGAYMRDWVLHNGWVLPPNDRIAVCGLPYFPSVDEPERVRLHESSMRNKLAKAVESASVAPADPTLLHAEAESPDPRRFSRLVFFGRLETRKGVELFVEAVSALKDRPCLQTVKEIVLLGSGGANRLGSPAEIAEILAAAAPQARIVPLTDLNTFEAQAFLRVHAHDSIVVVPSRQENYPMAVIEASLIPGLTLLCSDVGSIREILGPGCDAYLFEPFRASLATALESTLLAGPKEDAQSHAYQWQAANDRWLAFHERACDYAKRQRVQATPAMASSLVASRQPLRQVQDIGGVAVTFASGDFVEDETAVSTVRSAGHPEVAHRETGSAATHADISARVGGVRGHESEVAYTLMPAIAGTALQPRPAVDVCVTHYNLGSYLPYLLDSLDRQTCQDFSVYVVDDGSTDAHSREIFAQMRSKYESARWHFVRIENSGLSAARNYAAALGSGDYLMFVDADNVAPPNMVERFLDGIRISGDDCLTSYLLQFDREGWSNSYVYSPLYLYAPMGNSKLLGLIANEFGDANCIIRRSVFDAIGGFTTDLHKSLTGEDWEFFARLSFEGYRLDVIPEVLMYYRFRESSLIRSTETYLNRMRVLRVYEGQLNQIGLSGLAEYVAGVWHQGGHVVEVPAPVSMKYLVNHVSGFLVVKALALKIRNQFIRRLTGRKEF